MGCLFALFAGAFPRFAVFFIWLARPALFSAAFGGSWFLPLLGIIFLPFTTLMYVILWTPGIGVVGWDWLWLGLAVYSYDANQGESADIAHLLDAIEVAGIQFKDLETRQNSLEEIFVNLVKK